jgi:hypothetical protein
MSAANRFRSPEFSRNIVVVVGGYGSGKSEVSVNLARSLIDSGDQPVTIADLDVINPYFRSREAAEALATLGIRSLIPEGAMAQADLPVVIPQIKGALQAPEGILVLDVGGDDAGATVLGSLRDAFVPGDYEMLLTVNAYRPFTADVDGTVKMLNDIATASGLEFTGLISNSHLIEQTTTTEVLHGLELAREVSRRTELPICFLSATDNIVRELDPGQIDCPVLTIDRALLKPWERGTEREKD